ncbi:thermonuclease family protein [Erythrobacter sp. MTPC3]|uniref:thermonuclease family protein n=1 Tax=Erythrobacter sp. MTPC3 TaxID=3056564 RepID=UPI0036F2464D
MPKRRLRLVRPNRPSRPESRWPAARVPVLLLLGLAAWWVFDKTHIQERGWVQANFDFALCGQPWGGAAGCVVDGDTVVIGNGPGRRRIRLTGFDTPELNGQCEAEKAKAMRARSALHRWLARGSFEWSGDTDPPYDKYGRELRRVRRVDAGGKREYLEDHMTQRGLAQGDGWGGMYIDWCD